MDYSMDITDSKLDYRPNILNNDVIDLEIRPGTLELARALDLFETLWDDHIDEQESLSMEREGLSLLQQAIELDPNNYAARLYYVLYNIRIKQEKKIEILEEMIQNLTFLINAGAYDRDLWVVANKRVACEHSDEDEIRPVRGTELFGFILNIPAFELYLGRFMCYAYQGKYQEANENLNKAVALGASRDEIASLERTISKNLKR